MQRLQRIRDAGSNQAERKRRARLLALLAALIRVSYADLSTHHRPRLAADALYQADMADKAVTTMGYHKPSLHSSVSSAYK